MKRCIVIGGGFAGLTAASYLADSGFSVELIEASPKLGGRAYSFKENKTGSIIDNGQHIMMGCYRETLRFLHLIGADKNLIYQKGLRVNFLKENNELFLLKTLPVPYPLNLLSALLSYKALSIYDRFIFLKFFLKIPFIQSSILEKISVYEWLIQENQNERIRKAFWEILAVGALNTNISKASALTFAAILKEMFFSGSKAARIIIPKFGLTETYCNNAVEVIKNRDGEVNLLESVERIYFNIDRITHLDTTSREIDNFDFIISAVPYYSIKKILPEIELNKELDLNYSSIISIHIWLKNNIIKEDFYGLIDSPIHWIFNHTDHLTLVISDADNLTDKSKEELFELAAVELKKFTGIIKEQIIHYKIIKEKRATFIPSKAIINQRPKNKTRFENLFLAGDWIDTGLPSTIESAVKSGRMAADSVIKASKVI